MKLSARCPTLATAALLLLVGCTKHRDPTDGASSAPSSQPAVTARAAAGSSASAEADEGHARKVDAKTDGYEFSYGYPAKAGDIPALKRQLDGELDRIKAELASEARDGQADAKKNDYPFHQYSSDKGWAVVTDLPDWLSLSATVYTYSGGAHGMTVFDTLLWDKRAGTRRHPLDLFASKAAFRAAVAKPMCAALDAERAKRRQGESYAADDPFAKCIDPVGDATVILGSSDHRHFDRIGFLIPPYNAGPYAEGTYEVTVPVTPAMVAAVRPDYRDAFAPR